MIKKAAVINDLSGFGKCSLTAAIAVLSAMGVQPCPMPTAVLTNQCGFKEYYSCDFTDKVDNYIDIWQKIGAEFDGIYSGYVASERQIDKILEFIDVFKKDDTTVIVDPVMADNGMVYPAYTEATCQKMKKLAQCADIITPNITELCLLSDRKYDEVTALEGERFVKEIEALAKGIAEENDQCVIVTGIRQDDFICNGVFSKNDTYYSRAHLYCGSFSGTGDLFASVVCAGVLKGMTITQAVEKATHFIELSICDTIKEPIDPNHGVNFEKFLKELI